MKINKIKGKLTVQLAIAISMYIITKNSHNATHIPRNGELSLTFTYEYVSNRAIM